MSATTTPATYPDVYESTSKSRDYAIEMAAHVLGGQRSTGVNNEILFKAGLYKFEWLESPQHIACEGLPTISTFCKFRFTKIPAHTKK